MIRAARLDDVDSINVIYNKAILEGGLTGHLAPLSFTKKRAWFRNHRDRYTIAVMIADCSVVGYAAISPYREGRGAFAETCEISCYVSSEYRGRGLGKALVLHAVEHANRTGFHLVIAAVLGCNRRSIGLFTGLGFNIIARVPDAANINGAHFDHVYLARRLLRADLGMVGDGHTLGCHLAADVTGAKA